VKGVWEYEDFGYDAACKTYEGDWLKAKLRSDRSKRNEPAKIPNFTEWDAQDALTRAMGVALDPPVHVRLMPYRGKAG